MNYKSLKISILLVLFAFSVNAQKGYQKDSLQIKVYTEIKYSNFRAQEIKVKKVFCDYCNELQTKKISEEAKRLAYMVRNNKDNVVEKGIKKLAMYIRVSKKDFAAFRDEKIDN